MEKENPGYKIDSFSKHFSTKSIKFAKNLIENDVINLIGITTTSRLEIKVQGSPISRELFTDYKIDFSIIDEISKSTIPEILSIAKLSNQFMYAGDYRQLRPQFSLSQKEVEEFYDFVKNYNKMSSKNIFEDKIAKGKDFFKSWINELFQNSLFINLVEKMKQSKLKNEDLIAYQALTKQYRFNSVINEIVNYTYDKNEHLETFHNDSYFQRYLIGIRKTSKSFVNIVDTSFLSQDFIDIIKTKKKLDIEVYSESFDQNKSIIYNDMNFPSAINDYNAYVISKVLRNLFDKNDNLDPKIIGIITMTRSQAQLIQKIINHDLYLKKYFNDIKIDTVDNFQGQERKIIILDLVRAKNKYENDKILKLKNRDLSFYKSPERINVAVSRAKEKLIIIGAVQGYLSKEIISDVKINKKIESIYLFNKWLETIKNKGEVLEWENF